MSGQRRVAVLAGSSMGWREKLMRGIAAFSHERGKWHVYTAPEGFEDSMFFTGSYKWDGIIARVTSGRIARWVASLGVPAVSIGSFRPPGDSMPRVKVDESRLMELAARHLVDNGLRQFAYCGWFARKAEDRGPAFGKAVSAMGFPCEYYSDFTRLAAEAPWQARQRDLARWVKKLPKPIGITTWNPDVACQLVEACNLAKVDVPGQVAVIASDDDPMKTELTSPTVSAVELPAMEIGYEAAALLERLMSGGHPPEAPILVPPRGSVKVRESSGRASDDEVDVHRAARYIAENLQQAIMIGQVADSIAVSRRWLERHFRRVLGRSPHEELRLARIDAAKKLLLETDWPAARVGRQVGFVSAPHFNATFRKAAGVTPMQYRRRYRLR